MQRIKPKIWKNNTEKEKHKPLSVLRSACRAEWQRAMTSPTTVDQN